MVDKGIPCLPFPTKPFKNGQKHIIEAAKHRAELSKALKKTTLQFIDVMLDYSSLVENNLYRSKTTAVCICVV